MFRYIFHAILSVSFLCLWSLAQCQSADLDKDFVRESPRLHSPKLSPDGKYLAYCVEDPKHGLTTLHVKSSTTSWERTHTYNSRYFDGVFVGQKLVFTISNDSIAVMTLGGGDVNYFLGYQNFRVIAGKKSGVCFWKPGELEVYSGSTSKHFKKVHDYEVVGDFVYFFSKSMLDEGERSTLTCFNITTSKSQVIWEGLRYSSIVSNRSSKVAFIDWLADQPNEILVFDGAKPIGKHKIPKFISSRSVLNLDAFTLQDSVLVFSSERAVNIDAKSSDANVNIWTYLDQSIPVDNSQDVGAEREYFTLNLHKGLFISVSKAGDNWFYAGIPSAWSRYCLVYENLGKCNSEEIMWNLACKRRWYAVDILTGERRDLPQFDNMGPLDRFVVSPDGRFVVVFDNRNESYFSYSLENNSSVELTPQDLKKKFSNDDPHSEGYIKMERRGVAGWRRRDDVVFIYDRTDIWEFDLKGRNRPINITRHMGRDKDIIFSLLPTTDLNANNKHVVTAFDNVTKNNGFYLVGRGDIPVELSMSAHLYYQPFYSVGDGRGTAPIKADKAALYLVQRQSCNEYPNYYLTKDFISFDNVSNIGPNRRFKSVSSRLITWDVDGKTFQGILYIPEVFDSTKKYPVIFNVYEQQSNSLNCYVWANWIESTCEINPVLMANNGYLVFKPDLYFKPDSVGASALQAISAAALKLKTLPFIDYERMGIQGCSFGGFVTNYVVSHSNIFRGACTASGVSDLFGWASMKYRTVYRSFYFQQYRLATKIWENWRPYVANSPLLFSSSINTPLLIFHTSVDDAVPFNQGVQLFLILRRLGKKVWLLEYGGSANHGLVDPKQEKDFGLKMLDFFNVFLKDEELPGWMSPKHVNTTTI